MTCTVTRPTAAHKLRFQRRSSDEMPRLSTDGEQTNASGRYRHILNDLMTTRHQHTRLRDDRLIHQRSDNNRIDVEACGTTDLLPHTQKTGIHLHFRPTSSISWYRRGQTSLRSANTSSPIPVVQDPISSVLSVVCARRGAPDAVGAHADARRRRRNGERTRINDKLFDVFDSAD